MKKTGTSVDIRTIKNFPSDNPNAKIVKDGLFLRVVEREYYWSKEKQRGLDGFLLKKRSNFLLNWYALP